MRVFLYVAFLLTFVTCTSFKPKNTIGLNDFEDVKISINFTLKYKKIYLIGNLGGDFKYHHKKQDFKQVNINKSSFRFHLKEPILHTKVISFIKNNHIYIYEDHINQSREQFISTKDFNIYFRQNINIAISLKEIISLLLINPKKEDFSSIEKVNKNVTIKKQDITIHYKLKNEIYYPQKIHLQLKDNFLEINITKFNFL